MLTPPCSALAPSSQLRGSVPPPSRGPWPLPPRFATFSLPKSLHLHYTVSPGLPGAFLSPIARCSVHASLPTCRSPIPSTPGGRSPLYTPLPPTISSGHSHQRPHFGLGWDGEHKGGSVVLLADTCTFGDCSNAGDGA